MAIKENIELAQQYSHKEVEPKWSQKWLEQKLWAVQINEGRKVSIALLHLMLLVNFIWDMRSVELSKMF